MPYLGRLMNAKRVFTTGKDCILLQREKEKEYKYNKNI